MTAIRTVDKLGSILVRLSRLERRRLEKGLSQGELGKLAGLSQRTISLLENGKREPRPRNIKRLADALGCPAADLMEPERL